MDRERRRKLKELCRQIGYRFKDPDLLNQALTHKSYAHEHPQENIQHNERLEFLGDAVLGVITSAYLYKRFPNYSEGDLTKLKAQLVCAPILHERASLIKIGQFLLLGKGEILTGGREQPSSLTRAMEALIGAVYLDGGIKAAQKFLHSQMEEEILNIWRGKGRMDYKSILQEYCLRRFGQIPVYELRSQEGPDHKKVFTMVVKVSGKYWGQAKGSNKKSAEQSCAMKALQKLGKI